MIRSRESYVCHWIFFRDTAALALTLSVWGSVSCLCVSSLWLTSLSRHLNAQVPPESLTGVIRPGCLQLGLTARFESSGDLQDAWAGLLAQSDWTETLLGVTQPPDHRHIQN